MPHFTDKSSKTSVPTKRNHQQIALANQTVPASCNNEQIRLSEGHTASSPLVGELAPLPKQIIKLLGNNLVYWRQLRGLCRPEQWAYITMPRTRCCAIEYDWICMLMSWSSFEQTMNGYFVVIEVILLSKVKIDSWMIWLLSH